MSRRNFEREGGREEEEEEEFTYTRTRAWQRGTEGQRDRGTETET